MSKDLIKLLINLEKTTKAKLELLTAIGITSGNEETFKSCEEIRNELMEMCEKRTDMQFNDLPFEEPRQNSGNSGIEECEEILSSEQAIGLL